MVYTRKVKRGNKVYLYKYKSQRINGKVRSIYIGKELQKSTSKKSRIKKHKTIKKIKPEIKGYIPKYLIQFNKLVNEINTNLASNNINESVKKYQELLDVYTKLVKHIENEDKMQIYNKVKQVYDSITSTAETQGFIVKT